MVVLDPRFCKRVLVNRYLADQPGRDTKRPAFGHQVRPEAGTTEGPYDPSAATRGVDTLTKSVETNGIKRNANVFAELGSTWRFVMRDPTTAAHLLGKLLKHIGEDNVLWGTDSIWYGSPQDQIQAFRSFQIAPALTETHGYPELTPSLKQKIFGLNGARVYGVDVSERR
jgi:hypothetical protein